MLVTIDIRAMYLKYYLFIFSVKKEGIIGLFIELKDSAINMLSI